MTTTRLLLPVAAFAAALALAGCDAAGNVADAAQEQAKAEASEAVSNAVKDQICALVGDGQLTDEDITALSRVLDRAHDVGVPQELLDPAHEIVTDGEATASRVQELQANCA